MLYAIEYVIFTDGVAIENCYYCLIEASAEFQKILSVDHFLSNKVNLCVTCPSIVPIELRRKQPKIGW